MLSSSSSRKGSPGVTGRGRRCIWRKRKARKGGGSDGMQPSSKCGLVQGLLLQLGKLVEGLVPLAAGGALPLIPPPQLPARARQHTPTLAPTHPSTRAAWLLGLLCGRSCQGPRDQPGARITGRQGDEAERSEDPVRLKSPAHWPVEHFPSDQTTQQQCTTQYGNAQDPLLNSGSTLCQSREFRRLPPITIYA